MTIDTIILNMDYNLHIIITWCIWYIYNLRYYFNHQNNLIYPLILYYIH